MEYLVSSVIGYAAGSIPGAYLLLKKSRGIDITESGTGNVGAMNAYEVSSSKLLGLLVLLTDAAKGFLSVYLVTLIYPNNFSYAGITLIFAVLAHCFNPWLNFKGGRGLATAAGGSLYIFPYLLVVWIILYLIFYFMKKNIWWANIWATVMSLAITFSTSDIAIKYAFPKPDSVATLVLATTGVLIIVFIKHIDPLKEMLKNKRELKPRK